MQRGHFYKPGAARIVDQRCITAPAVRIAVCKNRCIKQLSFFFQFCQNQRIRLFHKSAIPGSPSAHFAFGIHQLHKRQTVFPADTGVILTKGRRVMYNARSVCGRDIIIRNDIECILAAASCSSAGKQRLVMHAYQIFSFIFLLDNDFFTQ